MKWVSSATLLLAGVFWGVAVDYEPLLTVVVFMGAIVALQQAICAREHLWATGFVAIALAFSPAAPLFQASGNWLRMMVWVCAVVFAVSLTALKTRPVLSLPSITDRNPGSESL